MQHRNDLIQKSALMFISHKKKCANMDRQLTEQEIRTMFDHMDKNHNGYVTAKELRYYLKVHDARVTNKEVKDFIRKIDESGDGQLSLHEFMKAFSPQRRSCTTEFRTIRR
ncbi:unnamed protein product [Schistosoma haematobium]|nr:unnamed protein product [Schistosoma haematobium]